MRRISCDRAAHNGSRLTDGLGHWWVTLACTSLLALGAAGCGGDKTPEDTSEATGKEPTLAALSATPATDIKPSWAAEIYAVSGTYTALQREEFQRAFVGSIVDWTLSVYDVERGEGGVFKVITQPLSDQTGEGYEILRGAAFVHTSTPEEVQKLIALRVGNEFHVKCRVSEVVLRSVVKLDPCILTEASR